VELVFGFRTTQKTEGNHPHGKRGSWYQEEEEKEMIKSLHNHLKILWAKK